MSSQGGFEHCKSREKNGEHIFFQAENKMMAHSKLI
jgi:hypothetical protein